MRLRARRRTCPPGQGCGPDAAGAVASGPVTPSRSTSRRDLCGSGTAPSRRARHRICRPERRAQGRPTLCRSASPSELGITSPCQHQSSTVPRSRSLPLLRRRRCLVRGSCGGCFCIAKLKRWGGSPLPGLVVVCISSPCPRIPDISCARGRPKAVPWQVRTNMTDASGDRSYHDLSQEQLPNASVAFTRTRFE
jgi:hypothetical protein